MKIDELMHMANLTVEICLCDPACGKKYYAHFKPMTEIKGEGVLIGLTGYGMDMHAAIAALIGEASNSTLVVSRDGEREKYKVMELTL